MARWRLLNAHYIKIPGTQWEYKEQDLQTGEQNILKADVPRLLDPNNPKDCRSPEGCVVAHAGKGLGRDWIMDGPPTPDMAPLDEEAQAITDQWEPHWKHPIDSLPTTGSQSYLPEAPRAVSASDPAFKALQDQVAALIEQNAKLAEQITRKVEAEPAKVARRA